MKIPAGVPLVPGKTRCGTKERAPSRSIHFAAPRFPGRGKDPARLDLPGEHDAGTDKKRPRGDVPALERECRGGRDFRSFGPTRSEGEHGLPCSPFEPAEANRRLSPRGDRPASRHLEGT